jgi:hypothetical protein
MSELELCRLAVELPIAEDLGEWSIERGAEPNRLLDLAKRYKVDAAKIRKQTEDKLKEAEGGTRREVEKKPVTPPAKAAKAASAKKAPAKKAGSVSKPKAPAKKK